MDRFYSTKFTLIIKKAKQLFFIIIFVFLMTILPHLEINTKQDYTFLIIELVLAFIVLISFIFILNYTTIYITFLENSLKVSIGLNKKEKTIDFTDIQTIEFSDNGKSPLTPLKKPKNSKGKIILVYPGKYKFEKSVLLFDLDTFVNAEELKQEFLAICDNFNIQKIVANESPNRNR